MMGFNNFGCCDCPRCRGLRERPPHEVRESDLAAVFRRATTTGLLLLHRAFKFGNVTARKYCGPRGGCLFHWLSEGAVVDRDGLERYARTVLGEEFSTYHGLLSPVLRLVMAWDGAKDAQYGLTRNDVVKPLRAELRARHARRPSEHPELRRPGVSQPIAAVVKARFSTLLRDAATAAQQKAEADTKAAEAFAEQFIGKFFKPATGFDPAKASAKKPVAVPVSFMKPAFEIDAVALIFGVPEKLTCAST